MHLSLLLARFFGVHDFKTDGLLRSTQNPSIKFYEILALYLALFVWQKLFFGERLVFIVTTWELCEPGIRTSLFQSVLEILRNMVAVAAEGSFTFAI